MAKNFYVVKVGWRPGIYTEWYGPDGAEQASSGYPGDTHPGFYTLEEALEEYKKVGGSPYDRNWHQITPIQAIDIGSIHPIDVEEYFECNLAIKQHKDKAPKSARGLEIDTQDIGRWGEDRWGEEWALYKLIEKIVKKYPGTPQINEAANGLIVNIDSSSYIEFIWNNKKRESGKSPDILIIENGITTYWEVKTTINNDINDFYISPNEWKIAEEQGSQYSILRVMGAGTSGAKIVEINNPYQLWLNGGLKIKGLELPAQKGTNLPAKVKSDEHEEEKIENSNGKFNKDKFDVVMLQEKKIQGVFYEGIGRRKEATARVRIYPGMNSAFKINLKDAGIFLTRIGDLEQAIMPLTLSELGENILVSVMVKGGGINGWVCAIQLGLARALLLYKPELRQAFRKANLVTRDARVKERKKPGLKRARKAPTYTKR